MNQVSKQNAKTDVERDFYNVLNNSNFGYDCRDNADNCFLIQYTMRLRNFHMLKNIKTFLIRSLVTLYGSEILERQIEEEYLNKTAALDPQDEYFEARKNSLEIQRKN